MERLETRDVIREEEKVNIEVVLDARKKRESGKPGVLKGRHSVAYPEVLELVRSNEKNRGEAI